MLQQVTYILAGFLASVIGCICGIGGGTIMKPVLDAFGNYSAATISFMSGCIVLSMTAYSVIKAGVSGESTVEKGASTFLGVGAAVGGVAGKCLFELIRRNAAQPGQVSSIQSAALLAVTLGTFVYTVNRSRIRTLHVKSAPACAAIGLMQGLVSAFLGIGGGPINLVVLYYFFSMETKVATQNSLYVILISQTTSLLYSVVSGTLPDFPGVLVALMMVSGILGGVVGRRINKRISSAVVDRLFLGLMAVIILLCCFNIYRYR